MKKKKYFYKGFNISPYWNELRYKYDSYCRTLNLELDYYNMQPDNISKSVTYNIAGIGSYTITKSINAYSSESFDYAFPIDQSISGLYDLTLTGDYDTTINDIFIPPYSQAPLEIESVGFVENGTCSSIIDDYNMPVSGLTNTYCLVLYNPTCQPCTTQIRMTTELGIENHDKTFYNVVVPAKSEITLTEDFPTVPTCAFQSLTIRVGDISGTGEIDYYVFWDYPCP